MMVYFEFGWKTLHQNGILTVEIQVENKEQ